MDLKYYAAVFARRWWIIALTTLLVSGFSYFQFSKAPVTYVAVARVLYEPNNVAASVLGSTGMFMPMSWNNPVETQLKLVRTRPNAQEVVDRLGLKGPDGKPRNPDEILGGLTAEVDRNTDIILLKYSTLNKEHAQEIVNMAAKVFVERNRNYHQETARTTREFIEAQLAKTEEMLNQAESQVRAFRESNQTFDVGGLGIAAAGGIATVDGNLITIDVDRKVAEQKLADARRHLEVTDSGLLMRMERLGTDPIYQQLQGELAKQEAMLTIARSQYTDGSPEVRDAEGKLAKLRASMHQRVQHMLGRGVSDSELILSRTPTEERYMSQLIDAQTELSTLTARAQALKASRSEYEARFSTLPAKEQELARLLRNQRAAEETYNVFLKRMQEIRITEAMNLGNVRLIEEAAHAIPIRQALDKSFALATLMGFVFGLGISLLLEFLDDRIRRPEEAENVLELPILGLLPWVEGKEASRRRLVVLDDPRSPVTESYRALQTYTRMVEPDTHLQCFMLTSPGPKEGKSTVVANLAITAAQLGKRVLLVDTDLRAPTQHINFDRPNLVGIYDVVYENLPVDEAVQHTDVENLHILTTGPVPPDPVQTLHSEGFKKMVEALKADYDAIFFDSPPINMFTDAAVLGRQVDSVLLVVDVRSTTRQNTLQAKELLTKARVPLAGMVVKNTTHQASKYHNRYYERYYMDRLKNLADD